MWQIVKNNFLSKNKPEEQLWFETSQIQWKFAKILVFDSKINLKQIKF